MARIRSIKPQAFTSESLAEVSVHARWTFAGLWTYVDDDGRGRADPRLIKGQLWPLDDDVTSKDVAGYLDELEAGGMICRYEIDGRAYLHVTRWREHQSIPKPTDSKLPDCPTHPTPPRHTSSSTTGEVPEDGGGATGGNKEQGRGTGKKDGKGKGDASADAPAPPRPEVEHLCETFLALVHANGFTRQKITQDWRDECRRMIDLDSREPARALALMQWALTNEFWKPNIQSIPTFREKYNQLRLQADAEWRKQREVSHSAAASTTDERVAQAQALKRGSATDPSMPRSA